MRRRRRAHHQRQQQTHHLLAAALGRAEHQHRRRVGLGQQLAHQLAQRARAVSCAQAAKNRTITRPHLPVHHRVLRDALGRRVALHALGVQVQRRVQPAGDGARVGQCGRQEHHLDLGVERTQLEEQQLEEVAALVLQRLRLVDDEHVDGGLLTVREHRRSHNTFEETAVDDAVGLLHGADGDLVVRVNAEQNVNAGIKPLGPAAEIALHIHTIRFAQRRQIRLLLLNERNVGKHDHALPPPKLKAAQHEEFVHQRLSDPCGSAVHEVSSPEDLVSLGLEQIDLPGKDGADSELVVVGVHNRQRQPVEAQIGSRKARADLCIHNCSVLHTVSSKAMSERRGRTGFWRMALSRLKARPASAPKYLQQVMER